MRSAGRVCIWKEVGIRTELWDTALIPESRWVSKAGREAGKADVVAQALIEQSFSRGGSDQKW